MADVRWLDEREQRAWRALQSMQMRLMGALARDLAVSSQLSYADYMVLVALTDQPEGRMRLFELGSALGWEKSRVSHHVARMAERGLVTKERCKEDRRGWYVVVTEEGRRAIAEAAPRHAETVRRLVVDRLTPAQLDVIASAAETVLVGLIAEEDSEC